MEPIVDRKARLDHLLRAARRPASGADFLMARAADDLAERLAAIDRRFEAPVALFCRTRHAADALLGSGKTGAVLRVEQDRAFLGSDDGLVIPDPESLALPDESADLIVSLYALHAVDDLPGILARLRRVLRPDGLFIAAFPGIGTLGELREALLAAEAERGAARPRVMPFADIRQIGDLLQRAGFAMPVADMEEVVVRYDSLADLARDLRAMGESNPLAARFRGMSSRAVFARAARIYAARHADPDGRIRATFTTIWLSGWAPHPDQPRPARRGSATVSLAEALRDRG